MKYNFGTHQHAISYKRCMQWRQVYSLVNQRPLQWHHDECHGVSNHHQLDCLLSRLFRRTSKKTPKLRFTGLCEGNPPVTGRFPSQRASDAENVSIWWRHHVGAVITFRPISNICYMGAWIKILLMSCSEMFSKIVVHSFHLGCLSFTSFFFLKSRHEAVFCEI